MPGPSSSRSKPRWLNAIGYGLALLVLVGVGAFIWIRLEIDRCLAQDHAILEFVARSRGKASYDYCPPDSAWLRRFVPRVICRVEVPNGGIDDDDLMLLRGCDHVTQLDLTGSRVTDDGLVHLILLPQLRKLDLSDTRLSDAGIHHLMALKQLRALDVRQTRISDRGVAEIENVLPGIEVKRDAGK